MLDTLNNLFNILLMLIGFGLVVFVHELGHFAAARWAGIRVPQFAIGFGPAVCSYRRGMGFRWGSTEDAYRKRLRKDGVFIEPDGGDTKRSGRAVRRDDARMIDLLERGELPGVSPTEYRLNWIFFGGYVKMIGQEDMDPTARTSAPASFNSKPVWKRMIVISAGVVMNIILAAALFMIVFWVGMQAPPPIIGSVTPGEPAALAGLQPGDVVKRINGRATDEFTEVTISAAMASPGEHIVMDVERPGTGMLEIDVLPVPMNGGLLTIGADPPLSNRILPPQRNARSAAQLESLLADAGLEGIEPDMAITAVNGVPVVPHAMPTGGPVSLFLPVQRAAERSGGDPVRLVFESDAGDRAERTFAPAPELQVAVLASEPGRPLKHLLGLVPLLEVGQVQDDGAERGLRSGDVFLRIGDVEFPTIVEGVAQIQAHAGRPIDIVVLRDAEVGRVSLRPTVSDAGTLGFFIAEALDSAYVTTMPPELESPATRVGEGLRGAVLTSIGGIPVSDFRSMRAALREATQRAAADGEGAAVSVRYLASGGEGGVLMMLTPAEVETIAALDGWTVPESLPRVMQPAQFLNVASGPIGAVIKGVKRTHLWVLRTYITFQRLFQGTVKVEHLKGPVGITHLGSRFADRGIIHLLFFLALISANLAVINFLPLPVVDGGMFVLLAIEGVTRKPVPVGIQNAAALVGLALIALVFIVVTFNDIKAIFM